MARDKFYFYISGLISLLIFTLFLSLAIYMMLSVDDVKQFALKKDQFISISIQTPKLEIKSTKKSVNTSVVKQKNSPLKQKEVNIDNLFSDVWTKSIKKQKKEATKIDKRRLKAISKKLKKTQNNKIESISKKIQTIKIKKLDNKDEKTSSASVVNEYFAKIQALVFNHFYPPQNSQGHTVRAVIKLSAIGKVIDFRVLNYSASTELNKECDRIKSRLLSVVFPVNPDNKSGNYTIVLTSKE
ncbi:MAG: hypothetical protein COB17_07470 [Sulfurimonas sp.]|nr:MAG: hypothetical protein COB17_07470 [Sulfurimonas sp.]